MSIASADIRADVAYLPEAATARGKARARREGLILRLRDDAGRSGLGSAAPLAGFSRESLETCRGELDELLPVLVGLSVDDAEGLLSGFDDWQLSPSARHALEQAVLDLASQRLGFPVPVLLGAPGPSTVPTHRLIRDAEDALAAVADGASTLKIKVGRDALPDDDRRIEAIRRAVGPKVALRLDANRAWSESAAVRALSLLSRHGIALCEEPVSGSDIGVLDRVRKASGVAVAADESCRDLSALEALIRARAVDAVVLKPMLIGGPRRTLAMARRAVRAGLQVIVTTSFESAVGWQAARWIAECLPAKKAVASGLDAASAISGPASVDVAMAFPNPIRGGAIARPDHPAYALDSGFDRSYAAFCDDVARTALSLAARGLGPGSVVAVVSEADATFIRLLHAIGWLGATVAPLADGPELARDLQVIAPDAVLAAEPALLPRGDWQALPLDIPLAADRLPERAWPLLESRVRLLTSGTTANPRPITLNTAQLALSTFGSVTRLGLDVGDRWLCCLPIHHIGGLSVLLRSAFQSTTAVLHREFDVRAVNAGIDSGDITVVSLVPTMVERLLDAREDRPFPRSLRAILIGGSALPDALRRRLTAISAPAAISWGMSEAASQVATSYPGDLSPGAPPLPFARVTADASGALVITGPIVMGTLVTGDRGHIDARGRVTVEGRHDDLIISGGENIAPSEIAAALRAYPAIEAAMVVGVPDARWGTRPVAAVVLQAGAKKPTAARLRTFLGERLAPFKIPDAIALVDALPRTALGKLSAAGVRRIFEEAEASQGVAQGVGDRHPGKALKAHKRVNQPDGGAQIIVLRAPNLVGKGDGAVAKAGDAKGHAKALSQTHRTRVVRLGVDQGEPVAAVLEDGEQGLPAGGEGLLEAGVAVLEDAAEEGDAGAIDLVEPDGDDVLVGHGRDSYNRKRPGARDKP
ncbi:MAG: o-succinylbenzoate synthase [Myxococcota bacterium]